MRGVVGVAAIAVCAGCAGAGETADTASETAPVGACGDVSSIPTLRVVGWVRDADENRIANADVSLVERNWAPGTIHGTGRTDGDGQFELDAVDLPVVEGCWGTAVQFWLEGSSGDLAGDKPMNSLIIDAWLADEDEVDLGAFPLILR